jgi:hypothetical protein
MSSTSWFLVFHNSFSKRYQPQTWSLVRDHWIKRCIQRYRLWTSSSLNGWKRHWSNLREWCITFCRGFPVFFIDDLFLSSPVNQYECTVDLRRLMLQKLPVLFAFCWHVSADVRFLQCQVYCCSLNETDTGFNHSNITLITCMTCDVQVQLEGLTGRIAFDSHGYRSNYTLDVYEASFNTDAKKVTVNILSIFHCAQCAENALMSRLRWCCVHKCLLH